MSHKTEGDNPWNLLRYGNAASGLVLLQQRHRNDSGASEIVELGVAYLWLGKYQEAEQHFRHAIKAHRHSLDVFFGMAGTAKWCVDEHAAAVEYWHSGLKAQYADAGGLGVKIPLLLFVASVLNPQVFPGKKAEEILMKKIEDPRAERWPGSLTKFVLGRDSNIESIMGFKPWPITDLEEAERKRREEADKQSRKWEMQFYGHILEFYNGVLTRKQLSEFMRVATDTSQSEFSNEHYFLNLMWSEEFFIARHETQKSA